MRSRILLPSISASILAIALAAANGLGAADFKRGDSNGDGQMDISDPVFTLLGLFRGGRLPSCLDAADANDDGAVNLSDAVATLDRLFRSGSSLPPPERDCGPDPTADALDCEVAAACPDRNSPPRALAGPDRQVELGSVVALDGSASSDPDGDALSFEWTLRSRPEGSAAALAGADSARASFVADLAGRYVAELVVGDGQILSAADLVAITARTPGEAPPAPATEVCNDGIDNDGDGLADAADPVCAPGCDQDGDGHAAPVCGGGDPDDADPAVYPGAPEICGDFLDNDGDGSLDEDCEPAALGFGPDGVVMPAGDQRTFAVADPSGAADFVFEVDGVEGGSVGSGTIQSLDGAFPRAAYRAPLVDTARVVTLTARDAADRRREASVDVRIVPLAGGFTVQPAGATVGLGATQLFSASIEVAGAGAMPLKTVFWKVNSVLQGTVETGRMGPSGEYRAPSALPRPLPRSIEVGFSLSKDGPVVARAAVLLAELILDPPSLTALEAGPAGRLRASIQTSDGLGGAVPAAELVFYSDRPDIGSVKADGEVVAADNVGRAVLGAVHVPTGARDSALLFGRSDVSVRMELIPRADDHPRIVRGAAGVTLIEYTQPGAAFQLDPKVTILRGQRAGTEVSAAGSVAMSFEGDGDAVVTLEDALAQADLSQRVAAVDRFSGRVVIGRRPGSGTITALYDDGFVQRQAALTVEFSRLELRVTARGDVSGLRPDLFITEAISFEVALSNPSPTSDYVGETPVRIRTADGTKFFASFGTDVNSGKAAGPFNLGNFAELEELVVEVPSSEDPFTAISYFRPDLHGKAPVKVSPRATGDLEFVFSMDGDPDAPPVSVPLLIKKPALDARGSCRVISRDIVELSPGDQVLTRSWVDIVQLSPGVQGFVEAPAILGLARNHQLVWVVRDPAGEQRFPATDLRSGASLSTMPTRAGETRIALELAERPEVRTEDFILQVLDPAGQFPELAAAAVKEIRDENLNPVPRANQLGAIHVEFVSSEVWVPGVPVTFRLRTYRATGEAGRAGKTILTHVRNPDGTETQQIGHAVAGVDVGGGAILEGEPFPNAAGEINLTVMLDGSAPQEGSDFRLRIFPRIRGLDQRADMGDLPVEEVFFDLRTGQVTRRTPAPTGIAQFVEAKHSVFLNSCVRFGGRGLAVDPAQVAVPSRRVREAIAAGRLPEDVDLVRLTVLGSDDFEASLASGVESADLGEALGLVDALAVDGRLLVVANPDIDRFESNPALFGKRTIAFRFQDGRRWQTSIEVVAVKLDKPDDHADKNLPLNARHHNSHPVGSQVFTACAAPGSPSVTKLSLELVPSLRPGDRFRRAPVTEPLVGFRRLRDAESGAETVSSLGLDLFQSHTCFFLVFGNRSDRRRLDPRSGDLGPEGDPDRLPDFVSPEPDAETLVASLEGNIADVIFFAAYNLVAEPVSPLHGATDDPFNFDLIKDSIETAYDRYSNPELLSTAATSESLAGRRIVVHVDNEARDGDLDLDRQLLRRKTPEAFWAGVLDQYYNFEGRTNPQLQIRPFGRDGRVGAFDGDRGIDPLDGAGDRNRRLFGIELDGVVFDPFIVGIDSEANGPRLLSVPLVERSAPSGLSAAGLIPDLGGTSGGYYDADALSSGSHSIVAKTPGADVPGLHGGYLIDKRPGEVLDPYFGVPEDDFGDVALKRKGPDPVGAPLVEEEIEFGGIRQPRRLHAFGSDLDRKAPIGTGISLGLRYRVTSDPPGLGPIEAKAALLVSERRIPPEESAPLIVTTQSTGSEGTVKELLDQASDLAIDLAATAILSVLTEGAYVACEGSAKSEFVGALVNTAVGLLETELVQDRFAFDKATVGRVTLANELLNDGKDVIDGTGIQVSAKDIALGILVKEKDNEKGIRARVIRRFDRGNDDLQGLLPCAVLKAPFEVLKTKVKDSFTAEDLGGKGAAEARAMKGVSISIPREAARGEGGIYNFQFSIRRRVDILPKEPSVRELSEVAPNLDRDAAFVSDRELIADLMAEAADSGSERAEEARLALNRIAVQSVNRSSTFNVYSDYKLRFMQLSEIEGLIVPGGQFQGQPAGDFTLTLDETELPVIAYSSVAVARTNQNATAQAVLTTPGFDLFLIKASIPSPPGAGPGFPPRPGVVGR
jgi:hypothetical protein